MGMLTLAAAMLGGRVAIAPAAPTAAAPAAAVALDPNALLLPPPTDGGPVKVAVALHVLNLSDIDEVKERFDLTGYLLADWRDPRLAYHPTGPADGFRALRLGSVWQPQLVLINSSGPRNLLETSLKVEPGGEDVIVHPFITQQSVIAFVASDQVEYTERFDATMTSTFELRPFPFDSQRLPVWTAAEFSSYSSLESWEFRSLTSSLGHSRTARGRAIPEARFVLTIQRRVPFYIWKVFLPLLLMVIVSWTVFWFDPGEPSSQVQIAVTTILTIIAFAFAIALTLPRVPYLTFADGFFLSCYVFAFLAMVELTAVHVAYRGQRRELALSIRYTARRLIPAAFVITVAALIVHFLL